jgi:DNA-binding XRE family transcriptional regulator
MSRIREFRERSGETQRSFAALVGVSAAAMSQFETGARKPSLRTANKVVEALNAKGVVCTLHEVFGDPAGERAA